MVYWCQILVPHYPAAKLLNFVRNKAMTKLPGYNGNYKRESFSHFFIVAIIIIFINTRHNLSVKRVHEAVNVTMASSFYKSFFLFSLEQESDFSLCLINSPRTKNYNFWIITESFSAATYIYNDIFHFSWNCNLIGLHSTNLTKLFWVNFNQWHVFFKDVGVVVIMLILQRLKEMPSLEMWHGTVFDIVNNNCNVLLVNENKFLPHILQLLSANKGIFYSFFFSWIIYIHANWL